MVVLPLITVFPLMTGLTGTGQDQQAPLFPPSVEVLFRVMVVEDPSHPELVTVV